MAAAGLQPFFHVEDANGNPYVSAKLYVYDAGTTTLKAIYSDDDLTASLANPLASDSAGNFARFYLATGTYKVRAETSAGVLIWQFDDIDTGLPAGTGSLPVASGGTGSTTAAGARTNLGVPASSELTTLSNLISALQTSVQGIIPAPQGRLTVTSATPVIAADVLGAAAVYWTPYNGNLCPIWNGSTFDIKALDELTLTLVSNHTADNIYDVFVFDNSGTPTLATGPAWNTVTAGNGARGSGAGTTELERKGGLWTNRYSITARNGTTTYTIDANMGTYVGSIHTDHTAGQVTCHRAYGQNRKFGVWNAYNRVPIFLKAGDSNATWTYGTNTIRAANNAPSSWAGASFNVGSGVACNGLVIFSGLPEEVYTVYSKQLMTTVVSGTPSFTHGIGYNSTTAFSGLSAALHTNGGGVAALYALPTTAEYMVPPSIGINTICAIEQANAGTNCTINGTEARMVLSAAWRG